VISDAGQLGAVLGHEPLSGAARVAQRVLPALKEQREPGLTPTEARIADLAAAGRSNKEISQMAFVSVKTVEANLTRIYRKLGVRSRTELAALRAKRKS
jgi:DNA-binding CsgD family transcriptional regulator